MPRPAYLLPQPSSRRCVPDILCSLSALGAPRRERRTLVCKDAGPGAPGQVGGPEVRLPFLLSVTNDGCRVISSLFFLYLSVTKISQILNMRAKRKNGLPSSWIFTSIGSLPYHADLDCSVQFLSESYWGECHRYVFNY